ncbi:hypothetical protein [Pararhizobium sp. IMCC21322]|uniref:hypothetical protein n=1 Tax=Pararhizobium sp. IMCC21322 TaxID=3067903 RepID=UPI002740F629|nr:hypothetical protein [Pararhizobium sp. IMCC21322]
MVREFFIRFFMMTALAVTAVSFPAHEAEARQELSGSQIKSMITGKRIFLKVPFGGEFPLRYASNGTVFGDGTALGLGKRMAPKEAGRWWVRNGQLCQQWKTWYKGQVACFRLFQLDGNELYWQRNDGRSGNARISN